MSGRSLTAPERRLLAALLAQSPDGEHLLAETNDASVAPSCGCGCGSIGFLYADHSGGEPEIPALFPIEGEVLDEESNPVGGLLLFLRSGRPHDLEVFSYADTPLPLPEPEKVRWVDRTDR
jgi:uncharacterized protein DUF6984